MGIDLKAGGRVKSTARKASLSTNPYIAEGRHGYRSQSRGAREIDRAQSVAVHQPVHRVVDQAVQVFVPPHDGEVQQGYPEAAYDGPALAGAYLAPQADQEQQGGQDLRCRRQRYG